MNPTATNPTETEPNAGQDPTDDEDEVLVVYRELLESDPSKDVRKMVLACLEVLAHSTTPA